MSIEPHQFNERSRLVRNGTALPTWKENFHRWVDDILAGRGEEDDAVSLGMKRLAVAITLSSALWMLSFLLVMMEIIQRGRYIGANIMLFFPMWVGSFIGIGAAIAITVAVCRNATLVSRERRLFMRAQGAEIGSHFIDYDSLPLMRRLFCWNLVMVVTYFMVLVTQILYSLWFAHSLIGVWHALVPTIIILSFYLVYLYIINAFSILACGVFTMLILQLILFTLKCSGQMDSANWIEATIPLMIVQLVAFLYVGRTLWEFYSNRIEPTRLQQFCMYSYSVALLLSTWAEVDTVFEVVASLSDESTGVRAAADADDNMNVVSMLPATLWTVTVLILSTAGLIIMNVEVRTLADKRGYTEPLPLSRTENGWEPTPSAGLTYYPLLGYMRMRRPTGSSIGRSSIQVQPLQNPNTTVRSVQGSSNGSKKKRPNSTSSKNSNGNTFVAVRDPTTFQQLQSNFEIEMPQRRVDPA